MSPCASEKPTANAVDTPPAPQRSRTPCDQRILHYCRGTSTEVAMGSVLLVTTLNSIVFLILLALAG